MNDQTPAGYSAAQALRLVGPRPLAAALGELRARTLALARCYADALGPGMQVPLQGILNPPRWELGHVAWFEQRWIARNPERDRGCRADPRAALAPSDRAQADAWYDSSAVAHDLRWSLPLPTLAATLDWMATVREHTLVQLAALPDDADDDALYFFRLVALHEAMHAEAAAYMARTLGFEVPLPAPAAGSGGDAPLRLPVGRWTLGWSGPGFAFDNELAAHELALPACEIDRRPVSWSRYGAFVAAGGYEDPRWWTAQGWAWRWAARPEVPRFPEGDAPAEHLSAHEAEAWCRWAGRRLPSEAEWERAAHQAPGFEWGQVWEWTASAFEPYPGFVAHPYRDYSQPWFGSRRVLRGASRATPACLAHPRFRNFFEPGRVDVMAGFRSCAEPPARSG